MTEIKKGAGIKSQIAAGESQVSVLTIEGLKESFESLLNKPEEKPKDYMLLYIKKKFYKMSSNGIFEIPNIREIDKHGKKLTKEDLKKLMTNDQDNQ